MDEADDFGNLYADLDDRVIDVIAAISESKLKASDSLSDEDTPNEPIGEADGKEAPIVEAEDGNGVADSSDSSDSEDDLRIVLNDEGRSRFSQLQSGALENGGVAAGWNDQDDQGDDLVLVTGTDPPCKDKKWFEQLRQPATTDGPMQGIADRGSTGKSGYRNWHVGSHLVGNNAITSMSGRGDWGHSLLPCSEGNALSNPGISVATTFSLPRNRTIFDIDIEGFANKPWKNHGADVTDYFNFGLDEESWTSYCKRMDAFRRRATMLRYPIYESRLNQVFDSEMVSTKTLSSDVARDGQVERSSSSHENVDKGGRGFEMPRGRAIRVEGSFGERLPSSDIRRLRLWDSDVVIQITMEDSMKDASVPCEEELKHMNGHIHGPVLKSENELHRSLSPDHDDQRFREIAIPVKHHYPENGTIYTGPTVEIKSKHDCKKGVATDTDDSSSCDPVLHSPTSDLESHTIAFNDGFSLEKVHSPDKKTSRSSVSGLQELVKSDCYLSNDSKSDGTEIEQENSNDRVPGHSLSMGDQKRYSRRRLQSRAELSTLTNSEIGSMHSYRKCQSVSHTMDVNCRARTRKCDYEFDAGGHFSSYEETEIPQSYKRRRDAEKPYVGRFHEKGSHDTSLRRNRDERDYLLKERIATRDNGIKQREYYFHERYHDDRRMNVVPDEDCNLSILEYKLWQKKEKKNERWIRTEAEYDDLDFEETYQEKYVQEIHRRHIPYSNREEEIFYDKFSRHVSHTVGELRNREKRSKYDSNLYFDSNRSSRYTRNDAKNWRYLDRRLLDFQTYREPPIADDRSWPDASSPTDRSPISWRSSERYVDHRRISNTREIQFKNKKVECYFVPSSKDHLHSPYENALSFDCVDHIAGKKDSCVDNIASREKGRSNWLAKQRHSINEMKYRNQGLDGLSSQEGPPLCDRSPIHEKNHVSQKFGSGWKISDDHLLNNAKKKVITEGSSASDSRDHANFVSDILDKGRHELATIGLRNAVNMDVNGWKGKLSKRNSEVIRECKAQSDMNLARNKKLKDARRIEEVNMKEVPPQALKAESCARSTGMQVERARVCKSEHLDDHVIMNYNDKNHIQQGNEDDEIEEGQLIEEPDDQGLVSAMKNGSSDTKVTYPAVEASCSDCVEEKNRQSKDLVYENKILGGYDSNRILETLAKMEKRRERFKAPITPKPIPEKTQNPDLDVAIAMEVVQQQRPARKRRWTGN